VILGGPKFADTRRHFGGTEGTWNWEIARTHSELALSFAPSRENRKSLFTWNSFDFVAHSVLINTIPASHSFRIEHLSRVYSVSHAIKRSIIGGLDAIMRMGY
jgi:hypothetical protein